MNDTKPFRLTGRIGRGLVIASPVAVIGVGHLAALWGQAWLGDYAWLPLTLVFWTAMATIIGMTGGWQAFTARLMGRATAAPFAWVWAGGAVVIGLAPLPLMILHWQVLMSPAIWLPWLVFAAINPFLEESYWRGVLLDATANWPRWLAIGYTSLAFAASHPLMWGTFSVANRTPETVIITCLMGVIWSIAYLRTGNLRWVIAGHILTDLLNLSIAAFMNQFPTSAPLW